MTGKKGPKSWEPLHMVNTSWHGRCYRVHELWTLRHYGTLIKGHWMVFRYCEGFKKSEPIILTTVQKNLHPMVTLIKMKKKNRKEKCRKILLFGVVADFHHAHMVAVVEISVGAWLPASVCVNVHVIIWPKVRVVRKRVALGFFVTFFIERAQCLKKENMEIKSLRHTFTLWVSSRGSHRFFPIYLPDSSLILQLMCFAITSQHRLLSALKLQCPQHGRPATRWHWSGR